MIVIDNPNLIKRKIFFTKSSLIASLSILGLGFFLSISSNSLVNFYFSLAALAFGYIFARINISLSSIWGTKPRQDELIAMSLKGLGDKYHLFQFKTAVPHLLLGPCGIWVINPIDATGAISYDGKNGKWVHKKSGGLLSRILSVESLGEPNQKALMLIIRISRQIDRIKKSELILPDIQVINLVINKKAELFVKESPIPTVHMDKIKDFFRKSTLTNPDHLNSVQALIDIFVTSAK